MAKQVFKNVSDGPRVLNTVPPITLASGEVTPEPVEISDSELKSAEATGWFETGKPEKPKADTKA